MRTTIGRSTTALLRNWGSTSRRDVCAPSIIGPARTGRPTSTPSRPCTSILVLDGKTARPRKTPTPLRRTRWRQEQRPPLPRWSDTSSRNSTPRLDPAAGAVGMGAQRPHLEHLLRDLALMPVVPDLCARQPGILSWASQLDPGSRKTSTWAWTTADMVDLSMASPRDLSAPGATRARSPPWDLDRCPLLPPTPLGWAHVVA